MNGAGGIEAIWRSDLDTRGLTGDVGDRAVYAIGDVHGCYDLALALVSAVTADIATLARVVRPLIVFCGDYIDRGPQSAEVLSMLVWMRRQAPCDVVCLKGNHEDMMIAFLKNPHGALAWLAHGGMATLASYGVVVDPLLPVEDQCEELRDGLLDRMPHSHYDLLHRLPIRMVCGDYVFVHAGLRPRVALDRQSDQDCLWIRHDFLDAPEPFEKTVVHGHTWQSSTPTVTRSRIGIDTGAHQTGVLTAVKLISSSVAFLQVAANAEGASS